MHKLGISNVSKSKVDHSKIEEFQKEVKINAIKAAKEKAGFLSSSLGQSIGKAIYIQEPDNRNSVNALSDRAAGANVHLRGSGSLLSESPEPGVEFEKIELGYGILVRFGIK